MYIRNLGLCCKTDKINLLQDSTKFRKEQVLKSLLSLQDSARDRQIVNIMEKTRLQHPLIVPSLQLSLKMHQYLFPDLLLILSIGTLLIRFRVTSWLSQVLLIFLNWRIVFENWRIRSRAQSTLFSYRCPALQEITVSFKYEQVAIQKKEKAEVELQLKESVGRAQSSMEVSKRALEREKAEKLELEEQLSKKLQEGGENAVDDAVKRAVAVWEVRYKKIQQEYEV